MKALITGVSSGMGWDMARILDDMGIEVIGVARREARLAELGKLLSPSAVLKVCDLSEKEACLALYESLKDEGIDILINNAGFGVYGPFDESNLEQELALLATNIQAVHILTKCFLRDFKARNYGYILNVASSAAFLPGPLLASYYASKAYVLRLSEAIYEELRRAHSSVSISVLCPGPVRTEFNERAGVRFSIRGLRSYPVARYAIEQMFRRRLLIIPGPLMKLAHWLTPLVPEKLLLRIAYRFQYRKGQPHIDFEVKRGKKHA